MNHHSIKMHTNAHSNEIYDFASVLGAQAGVALSTRAVRGAVVVRS